MGNPDNHPSDTRSPIFRGVFTVAVIALLGTPFVLRLQQTDDELEELRGEIDDLQRQMRAVSRQTDDLKGVMLEATDAATHSKDAIRALIELTDGGLSDLAELRKTIRAAGDAAAHVEPEILALRRTIDTGTRTGEQVETDLRNLRSRIDGGVQTMRAVEQDLAAIKPTADQLAANARDLAEASARARDELEQARSALTKARKELDELRQAVAQLQSTLPPPAPTRPTASNDAGNNPAPTTTSSQ